MSLNGSPKAATSGQSKPADGKRYILNLTSGFTIHGSFLYSKNLHTYIVFGFASPRRLSTMER